MLWGKGDSSKLSSDEVSTLSQLRRMVETGHIVALSPGQSEILLRALDWYTDWEGTFRILKHVRNVIGLLGFFFVTAWATGSDPVTAILGMLK